MKKKKNPYSTLKKTSPCVALMDASAKTKISTHRRGESTGSQPNP
ncbi:hypothetical protein BDA96_01G111500 [Sorghum bicolor]|uniref:Uncharacterized protein n=1 Tax=Sorghum bicolor TaxID=4558 RepID=A0A921RX16_SORBI|nr:hypothetical protein BDA96_01G111500 [Sorghum bicolor]